MSRSPDRPINMYACVCKLWTDHLPEDAYLRVGTVVKLMWRNVQTVGEVFNAAGMWHSKCKEIIKRIFNFSVNALVCA